MQARLLHGAKEDVERAGVNDLQLGAAVIAIGSLLLYSVKAALEPAVADCSNGVQQGLPCMAK